MAGTEPSTLVTMRWRRNPTLAHLHDTFEHPAPRGLQGTKHNEGSIDVQSWYERVGALLTDSSNESD